MLKRIKAILMVIQFSITVAIVIVLMYSFKKSLHKIIKVWMKMQIKILGINLVIEGKLDPDCQMYIMNHQSIIDIVIFEHLHNKHLAWVGKKEISNLFLFGHIMKAPEMIAIDRDNKAGLIKLIHDVKDRLEKNRPVAMFPEGTRSKGDKILPFKAGAAMVANKLKLKVQPVVMINTRPILDSQNLKSQSGTVKIIYLDPIQADRKTTWFKDTEDKMREVFMKEISK